jgi:hypothetical protein
VKVRVNGTSYKVIFDEGLIDPDLHAIKNYGLTDLRERYIKIDDSAPSFTNKEGLFHELLHVADAESGTLDMLTEVQNRRISRMLYGILVENPKVVKYLFPQKGASR